MDKYEIFRKNHLITKEDVKKAINNTMDDILKNAETDPLHSYAYYTTLRNLLEELKKRIDSVVLMEKLEDGWCYDWGVSYYGADFQLVHYDVYDDYIDDPQLLEHDQLFTLFTVPTKLLTVEEFASLQGVEVVTIRQWIRRGKIRTVKKYGNEWRIPALTDTPKRGYTSAHYTWSDTLTGLPKGLEYLNDYIEAIFVQDDNDKKSYFVQLYDSKPVDGMMTAAKTIQCNTTERERIELALISQPSVVYHPNYQDNICIDLMHIYPADVPSDEE